MAVTPLGNTIFINQNANFVSHRAAEVQNRFDLQAAVAASITEDERGEIEQIRPTEETYKIDPQNEQEGQKHQQDSKKQNKENKSNNELDDVNSNDNSQQTIHHLDIEI